MKENFFKFSLELNVHYYTFVALLSFVIGKKTMKFQFTLSFVPK